MLERVCEADELSGRVRMGREERAPVERAQAHEGVLQRRRVAAEGVQPLLDQLAVPPGLRKMGDEELRELPVAEEALTAFEQPARLLLDRVGVGEVLREPVLEVGASDRTEGRVDGKVEEARQPVHHRLLLIADPACDPGGLRLAGALGDQP
jgi:hypothetical protein